MYLFIFLLHFPSFLLVHHHLLARPLNLRPGPLSCFSTETFFLPLLLLSLSSPTYTLSIPPNAPILGGPTSQGTTSSSHRQGNTKKGKRQTKASRPHACHPSFPPRLPRTHSHPPLHSISSSSTLLYLLNTSAPCSSAAPVRSRGPWWPWRPRSPGW